MVGHERECMLGMCRSDGLKQHTARFLLHDAALWMFRHGPAKRQTRNSSRSTVQEGGITPRALQASTEAHGRVTYLIRITLLHRRALFRRGPGSIAAAAVKSAQHSSSLLICFCDSFTVLRKLAPSSGRLSVLNTPNNQGKQQEAPEQRFATPEIRDRDVLSECSRRGRPRRDPPRARGGNDAGEVTPGSQAHVKTSQGSMTQVANLCTANH